MCKPVKSMGVAMAEIFGLASLTHIFHPKPKLLDETLRLGLSAKASPLYNLPTALRSVAQALFLE